MDIKEIQKKENDKLKDFINEKREELRSLRFSATGSGMRDSHARRNTRKDIARGLTELNRRSKEETSKAS